MYQGFIQHFQPGEGKLVGVAVWFLPKVVWAKEVDVPLLKKTQTQLGASQKVISNDFVSEVLAYNCCYCSLLTRACRQRVIVVGLSVCLCVDYRLISVNTQYYCFFDTAFATLTSDNVHV